MNSDPIQCTGDAIIVLNKTNAKYRGKSDAKTLLVLKRIDWLVVLSGFFPTMLPILHSFFDKI